MDRWRGAIVRLAGAVAEVEMAGRQPAQMSRQKRPGQSSYGCGWSDDCASPVREDGAARGPGSLMAVKRDRC